MKSVGYVWVVVVPVPTGYDAGRTHKIIKEPNYVGDPIFYPFDAYILK